MLCYNVSCKIMISVRIAMLCKKSLRRIGAAVLCAASLLSLTACSGVPKSTKAERETVMSIDGFEVPYEQFRYLVCNYMDEYAAGDENYWTVESAALAQDAIFDSCFDTLCTQYATLSLCREYGVDMESGAINELVDSLAEDNRQNYESDKAYVSALRENYMTDSVYRFFTRVRVCQEELYYALLEKDVLTSDDSEIYPLLEGDTFIRVKQILIANDPGEDPAENRRKAEELHSRALAGEDFDTLVQTNGEDLYMFNNTDGYYICRGVWYHEFEDTAFSLDIGEISDVIETAAGYSILLRCEKDPAYLSANRDDLCTSYRDAQFSLLIERKAASLTPVLRDPLYNYTLLTIRDDFDK